MCNIDLIGVIPVELEYFMWKMDEETDSILRKSLKIMRLRGWTASNSLLLN